MTAIQEYKCPCCGGAIAFDAALQKMKCPYCDTEFEIETLAGYHDELQRDRSDDLQWEIDSEHMWQTDGTDGLCSYVCKSCGGEIVGDENTAATSCPFCGNPVVMTERISGLLKPDYVIPFKMDKMAAKEALRKHYMGKRLLPKIFQDENHIDEVKGIYVPFWLFDAEAEADIRYKATRIRTWRDTRYNYVETSYYAVLRSGKMTFERVPVDGSEKMADNLMESLEPFDFSEAVDFQAAYLAGYLADKYDVDAGQSTNRANERIRRSTEDAFAATVAGYTSVMREAGSIRLHNGKVKYALFPVWILNTTWNGRKYTFAMNGQSGKMVGDLPLDKKAYIKWLLGLTGVVSAAVYAVLALLWLL